MKKIFIYHKDNKNDYAAELQAAYEITKASDSRSILIPIEQLAPDLLREQQVDVVISDGLLPEQYDMVAAGGYVSIVFGSLAAHEEMADIVIDRHAGDLTANYGTAQYSLIANSSFNFSEMADLFKKLSWDSDFWGYGVGNIKSKSLSKSIYQKSEKAAKAGNVKVIEYLCSVDDKGSIRVAEELGFQLVDIRVTFEMKARKIEIDPLPEGLTYGIAEPRHIPELIRISRDLYRESRYYFDGGFDRDRVSDFYNMWVEKAVLGTFDHLCYCIFNGDTPVGFATFRHYGPDTGYIGLAGFSEVNKGQGLGKKLFSHLVNESIDKGIKHMVTATQGRNYSAQRLFQSIGFKTSFIELWYHKWLA